MTDKKFPENSSSSKKPAIVPLGPSLDSTDEELDDAAEITLEDLERAKITSRRHGQGSDLDRMLDAEAE